MKTTRKVLPLLAVGALLVAPSAHAFLIFFPLPNLAKPPELQRIIDTLEGSQEVKAVAFASEDKTFGSKMWVWGHHSGKVTQDEADRQALRACEDSLAKSAESLFMTLDLSGVSCTSLQIRRYIPRHNQHQPKLPSSRNHLWATNRRTVQSPQN